MRTVILAAALCAAVLPTATQAAAPRWTILRQECWHISQTAGQCAVNLMGIFASRDECLAANNGQVEQKGEQDGRDQAMRCEMLLEE